MAGLEALDIGFKWLKQFFTRKDEKREKDAGKAIMSGKSGESAINRVLNQLYPKSKK